MAVTPPTAARTSAYRVIAVFTDTDFPPEVKAAQGSLMSWSYSSLSRHRPRLT
jgi:hypothetical protein